MKITKRLIDEAISMHVLLGSKLAGEYLESVYIEFFNDFLTVPRFAEYYDIGENTAQRALDMGKAFNHKYR
jgi:hypothetical protein